MKTDTLERRVLTRAMTYFFVVALFIGLVNSAYAQSIQDEDNFNSEDLVLAVFVDGKIISAGIFAVLNNGRVYLPAKELSDLFGFNTDLNLSNRTISGEISSLDQSFKINTLANELIFNSRSVPLPSNAVLDNTIAGDDLYVLLELYNEIWPLEFSADLSSLTLNTTTDSSLPFQDFLKRKENQQKLVEKREAALLEEKKDYTFAPYPYQLIGRPSIDLQFRTGFDGQVDNIESDLVVSGVQDLMFASMDFSSSIAHTGSQVDRPDSIRLRFTREDIYDGALPFDLERVQAGDVSIQNRDLVSSNTRGRGLTFSTDKNRSGNFDTVTIEGIGIPGYEVELYLNNQLIDFTEIDDSGIYEFEDVNIFFGNNVIRTVLYGPQGQLEERVESYFFGSNMLRPGEYSLSGGILDQNQDLIPIDERDDARLEGLNANLFGAYGVNQRLTAFASASTIKDRSADLGEDDVSRQYISIGGITTLPTGFLQGEIYQELSGGTAAELRTGASFKGFNFNFRGALFSDFESPEADNGDRKKVTELEGNIIKNYRIPFGSGRSEISADYLEREDGTEVTNVSYRQTARIKSTSLANNIRANFVDGNRTTNGSFSTTTRLDRFRLRNAISYNVDPEFDVTNFNTELRYGNINDLSAALRFSRSFSANTNNISLQLVKDFKKFLGSVETNFSSEFGTSVFARASASFGPYNQDGSYMMTSNPLRSASPISAFVFRDVDYDGEFTEVDEPIENARIEIDRRIPKERTNEDGYVAKINAGAQRRFVNVGVSKTSIEDPYLEPAVDGYSVYPRPGVRQAVVLPLIDTGAIDGTFRWANDGKGLGGLEIQLMNENGDIVLETTTAPDGYYTFEKIPPGAYRIVASPETGLDIPFTQITLTKDNLFQFGMDVEPFDPDRPMVANFNQKTIENDGTLNADKILSIAKNLKGKTKSPSLIKPANASIIRAPENINVPNVEKVASSPRALPTVPKVINPIQKRGLNVFDRIAARMNSADSSITVEQVQVSESRNMARLIIDLSAPIEYSISSDPATNLIFIEMPNVSWATDESWQSITGAIINSYNVEQTSRNTSRLVVQVNENVEINASGIIRSESKDQLYIDITAN
ncbi:MAG: SdrD B-like domain-containing protein [Pseudomonadota bacterium]